MKPTTSYINDLDLVLEAIENGDERDAKNILREIQEELKGKHLIEISNQIN